MTDWMDKVRIQVPPSKPDMKEICKDVERYHSSGFFNLENVIFYTNICIYVTGYVVGLLLLFFN